MERPRDHCIRCGECCLSSTPSLQIIDLHLVHGNSIKRSDLYTVRVGEIVRDNIRNELKTTDRELVKVREKEGGGGCVFYRQSERKCAIYDQRPAQCRALACWDNTEFFRVYATPKAGRRELIRDRTLLRLMDRHEERCAYSRLEDCVKRIGSDGGKAVEEILGILKFDHDIRRLIPGKLDVDPREMDLLLGRPLTETIVMFGLKIIREPDGTFFLTTLRASSEES